jgi:hypothetical protein
VNSLPTAASTLAGGGKLEIWCNGCHHALHGIDDGKGDVPLVAAEKDASREDWTMQPNPTNFFESAWLLRLLLLGILMPAAGHAAPFCLQSEAIPPQCIYYDAALCAKDAGKQGGECSANKNEFRLALNVGKYCMVTSQRASLCIYASIDSCLKAATAQGGACVESQGTGSGGPNPHNAYSGD